MKHYFLPLLFLLSFLVLSCEKSEIQELGTNTKGKLSINLKAEDEEINIDNFQVTIFDSEGQEMQSFGKTTDIPEEIELEPGIYYIIAHSSEDLDPLYYEGRSEEFEIKENETLQIEVLCTLKKEGTFSINLTVEDEEIETTHFKTTIYSAEGEAVKTFEETKDIPETIELDPGIYYIIAHSTEDLEPLYYEGKSEEFEISNESVFKNIDIICTLIEKTPTGQIKIKITAEDAEANTENFFVSIYNSEDHQIVMSFDKASEMPETIELEVGSYYVIGQSNEELEIHHYEGKSEVFTIQEDSSLEVEVYCPVVWSPDGEGTGTLALTLTPGDTGLELQDFEVSIHKADTHEQIKFYDDATKVPSELDLEVRDYYIEVKSKNALASSFDKPLYGAKSNIFRIEKNRKTETALTCTLQSAKVSVVFTADFKNTYVDSNNVTYDYQVTLQASDIENSELTFSKKDNPIGYFHPSNKFSVLLEIFNSNNKGGPFKYSYSYVPFEAGHEYKIIIDVSEPGPYGHPLIGYERIQ
ncbi:DUF4493 domain-containing protein [Xanthovirga aplysinae]|uniref:DUF4493 domain-containing protein n=1 Tax=Xanthovirga aplysinae TaxID=2529853 RepID=UPI0012BB5E95|nr:DUF4493 domain-containing protein [Xanthovirga aplysinae]MTI32731.1 DUF4493 domain-containing protein [Xanthovirga aplysinae]